MLIEVGFPSWHFVFAVWSSQVAFRLGSSSRLDERCFAMQQFKVMPLSLAMLSVYPKMYPIHDLSDEVSIAIACVPKHFEGWGTKKETVVAISSKSLKIRESDGITVCEGGTERKASVQPTPGQPLPCLHHFFVFYALDSLISHVNLND